ncbi:MAG TPA: hypothetical protein VN937_22495 [Blastocatellia bacterium]|jgi:hypothetical protein|nr:hypothetical protein [Blastocatellia bacterium]
MAKSKAAGKTEQKVVMTIPDMGLSTSQVNALKKKFQNEIVTSLGGQDRLKARNIVIVIVVIIVYAAAK